MPAIEPVNVKEEKPQFGKYGTPRPAGSGALPRFVQPIERATGTGAQRFKLMLMSHDYRQHVEQPVRYVLAKSADEALKLFRKETRLDEIAAKFKGRRTEEPDSPDITVVALPD